MDKLANQNLFLYIKKRAEVEGVAFDLDEEYLEQQFQNGFRQFFGVQVDDEWNMLFDEQEPYENFFSDYLRNIIN